jgi:hypothetical protein
MSRLGTRCLLYSYINRPNNYGNVMLAKRLNFHPYKCWGDKKLKFGMLAIILICMLIDFG